MATTYVDHIAVSFGVDAKEVARGMKEAEKAIGGGLKKITSILMPIAGGFALKGMVDTYRNTADQLGKLSESIGVNMQDLNAWGMAAELCGGSAEGLQGSVESLNQRLQTLAATGKGPAKAALEALGISATDAAGKAKEPMDVMLELAEQAENMDKAKFVGLAGKLGLDKGTIMLLQQGKMSVQDLTDKMKKYTYTKEDARTAEKYNDALSIMSWSFRKLVADIMQKVLPVFTRITDGLTSFFDVIRERTPVAIGLLSALAVIFGTKLVFALKALNLAWMTNPVTLVVTAIVAAIVAITLIIDDFLAWLDGGKSYFADQWQDMADAVKWLSDAWEVVKRYGAEFFAWLAAAPGKAADMVVEQLTNTVNAVLTLGREIKRAFGEGFDRLANAAIEEFTSLWASAKQLGSDFLEWVTTDLPQMFIDAFNGIVEPVLKIFTGLWEGIKHIFSGVGSAVTGTVKDAVKMLPDFKIFDSVKAWAVGADSTAKDVGEGIQEAADVGNTAAASTASKGGDTTIDNSQDVDVVNNITVTTNSDEPQRIGEEVGRQVKDAMVQNFNSGVNGV